MKKSKFISLVLLPLLILGVTLIPSGNVSALGVSDFFLTDEELPSGWKIYQGGFVPQSHMALRMKLIGGSWSAEKYEMEGVGTSTVVVGYYSTEEEAKKVMHSDVYICGTDVYTKTGTTLLEWAQQSTEYVDQSFWSSTAYGDEGFTAQTTYSASLCDDNCVRTGQIFRIGNVIFHTDPFVNVQGVLEPLLAEKARWLLGSVVADSDGDGVPDDVDACLGTPAGVAVDDKGCPIEMQLSVSTDKKTYSPGETVIIRGSVWDAKGGLDGATVVVDVDGTKLTATTDSSGNYKKEVPLPPDISQGTHTVTVNASKTGYPGVSKTMSFNVGGEFKVSLKTDKENYDVGDEIKINGVVTSPDPIGSDLELNLEIKIYDSSGSVYRIQRTFIHSDGSYDEQIKIFDKNKPGPLGQGGEIGKWRIEAIAKKTGYPDAKADKNIVVQGWCGDQVCQGYDNGEYCYNCSDDCKCEHGKICDPFSKPTKYTDPKTKCSPKVAYIFISTDPNLDWRHKLMMKPRIKDIEKFYEKEGYKVIRVVLQGTEHEIIIKNKKTKDKIWVANKKEIVTRLAKPSTKAIAFFGHGGSRTYDSWVPFCDTWIPTLGGHSANELWLAVLHKRKSEYKRLGLNDKDAGGKAMEQKGNIELDYAYMFACHSLDDNSLRDFLVRKGGTYWGEQGTLTGSWWLEESKRTE